jgi:hypothetical protein
MIFVALESIFFLFAGETKMAIEGGRISPLVVGVDCGHPQAAGGGSWPPLVAGSISFFFFLVYRRDKYGH